MGTVYIGLPGPWAKDSRESSDHYTTKIGGLPDWPSKELDIKADLLTCRVCGKRLYLVAQVYAPLSLNGMDLEERNIYVFGCSNAKCAGNLLSWRALRIQRWQSGGKVGDWCPETALVVGSVVSTSTSSLLKKDVCLFGDEKFDNENDDSDMDLEELSRALSEATMEASNFKKESSSVKFKQSQKDLKVKGRVADPCIPALPCFYIYAQEEPRPDTISDVSANRSSLSLKENWNYITEISDEGKWEGEVYEYDKALQADRTYLKFKKRVDLFPEQCLRYSFGGQPLLAAATAGEPGTCSLCNAGRHYEMQLMPALMYFLHQDASRASVTSEDWDWMTLIIYTCSNSCFNQSSKRNSLADCWTVVEEAVFVQDESTIEHENNINSKGTC